ncbi:MAG: YtxH domain-containing protein [Dehalococcoidia bacterium]|jgi:gas vesicle protein|nr:YtxH domain-containing protein [Dehalococcoidia bacterium]
MEHSWTTVYKNALCAGAFVGGTLGLLFAPRPGVETRRLLQGKAELARKMSARLPALRAGGIDDEERRARKLASLHFTTRKEVSMQNKILTMGFVTGAIIGGVVGLLYAPRAGRDTRDYLKSKAEYTAEEAKVFAGHAKELALEKARQARAAAAAATRAAERHEAEAQAAEESQG